jgi:hypothetical protein
MMKKKPTARLTLHYGDKEVVEQFLEEMPHICHLIPLPSEALRAVL